MSGQSNYSSSYLGDPALPSNKLSLSQPSLFFELKLDGTRSNPQKIRVTNTGSATQIKKVAITSGSLDFSLVEGNAYPTVLENGQFFDITVDFTARVDGIAVGVVEIYTNEDRLPYTTTLKSRTQRTLTFADEYNDLFGRIGNEANTRSAADIAQNTARSSLDTALRALIAAGLATEAGARTSAINTILSRLGVVENGQISGTVFGIDAQARADIVTTNLRITDEISGSATSNGAIATRLSVVEAGYQSAGQVTTIANARVAVETAARVNADAAEASQRTTLAATLRSETGTALAGQALTQSAAITLEQIARAALGVTLTGKYEQLQASSSNARGVTLNGAFGAGSAGWLGGVGFATDAYGNITALSNPGQYASLYSEKRTRIDPTRVYQLNCQYRTYGAAITVHVGVRCYTDDGTYLGNIYGNDGTAFLGSKTINQLITGQETYPIPTFRTGNKFPTGTTQIELIAVINEFGVTTGYGRVFYLWLDDVTNAQVVDARLTESQAAQTTVNGGFTNRLNTAESNYVSTQASLVDLNNKNAQRAADIVTANARITNEENTRANAVSAEASRVNNIFVSYSTTGQVNSLINAAVQNEATIRANADGAEVTRVNNLIASYSTTSQMNTAITAGVQSETTARVNADASILNSIDSFYATYVSAVANLNAAVTTETNARASADNALSSQITSATATANGAAASASTALAAAADAQGKLQARILLRADAGNGRAQLELWADSYGSAGVDIVGNVRIQGSLLVTGSVQTDVLAGNSVTTTAYAMLDYGGNLGSFNNTWQDFGTSTSGGSGGGGGGGGGGYSGGDIP